MMQDFDDHFAERLDEEASFSGRSKNWKHLSKRLDAFEAGMAQSPGSALQWWKAAALLAIAVAGVLLWKTIESRQENRQLRTEIAILQQTKQARPPLNIPVPSNPTAAPSQAGAAIIYPEKKPEQTSSHPATARVSAVATRSASATTPAGRFNSDTTKTALAEGSPLPGLATAPEIPLPAPTDAVSGPLAVETSADSGTPAITTDSATVKKAELPADSMARLVQNAPTRPVQSAPSRFSIGVRATLGMVMPSQPGVTALRGQGLHAEARIIPSLWAMVAFDWLHHEVATNEFAPRFHPRHDTIPRPPVPPGGGGGPHTGPKLILVESAPRQQQLSLGLRYELPVALWLKPSLRLSHTWVRVAPTLVTYKFEDNNPGGPGGPGGPFPPKPAYTAEKFDAQWHQNQWRVGIGLERNITDWTFGLSADYSRDFSSATPHFDALYLRAGAQYRF
jgi:hypothetical protein